MCCRRSSISIPAPSPILVFALFRIDNQSLAILAAYRAPREG
jgi:hypothetical protein